MPIAGRGRDRLLRRVARKRDADRVSERALGREHRLRARTAERKKVLGGETEIGTRPPVAARFRLRRHQWRPRYSTGPWTYKEKASDEKPAAHGPGAIPTRVKAKTWPEITCESGARTGSGKWELALDLIHPRQGSLTRGGARAKKLRSSRRTASATRSCGSSVSSLPEGTSPGAGAAKAKIRVGSEQLPEAGSGAQGRTKKKAIARMT